ncbi:uncharacterized protein H6S33_000482 [Morchella sextelata]|uniref:uncharacterized protein n=1 Tax=Morchella sextelata TaxID=1174677 RepID=UPI001D03F163|nr:uncharacterized protein H6S33_000482 [Morchella sextelata]KAH0614846.1 hypothetical protein H6S33_000482 [Morchella sextelata]
MPGVPPNTVDLLKKFGRSLFNRKKKSKTPVEETTEHGEQSSQTPSAAHDTPVNVPAVAAPPPPAAENAAAAAPQIEESREVAPTAAPAAETITPAPAPGVDVPKEAETVLPSQPTAPQLDAPKKEDPIGEIDLPSTEYKKTDEVAAPAAAATAPAVAAAAPPAEK